IPGGAAGEPDDAAGLVVRVNRLEEELRQANGRIEELQNAQRRLEAQLQKFRQDVEFRLGDRSRGAPPESDVAEAPLAPDQPGVPQRPRKSDAFDPNADPNAPGAPRPLGTTPPSAPLVREAPAAGPPLELGKGPPPAPPASGPTIVGSGVAMLDQPREQFNAALQAFQAGQYPEAEVGFKAFLAANPAHRLTPDAIFYIGETYLERSRPREAAEQYLKVTTDYSKSQRAPESMVRLGQTLAALGNSEQACATLTEFGKRYPAASASVKKLAEHESARDHC
ncbi:MAG: tol-pal system protein YbgF, partial [Roseiarcus sp.]